MLSESGSEAPAEVAARLRMPNGQLCRHGGVLRVGRCRWRERSAFKMFKTKSYVIARRLLLLVPFLLL